jgi:hyperosmotically inducible periplasmic protein
MKTLKLFALLVMAAAPAMIFASTETDRQIEDAAKSSYNFRVVLDNAVTARSDDGVVTLTGTVQDKDQKNIANDTVSNLPGVVSVNNQIEVQSTVPEHSDAWIAWKIRGTLLVRANVSTTNTKVDVNNGVVLLTGTADNQAQKDLTEAYAKDVEGVKSVKNEIVVANPPVGETDRTVGDVIDDASITTQVKFALLSHSSTSAFATKVKTKDGVVMISGEASSDAERSFVTKLANSVRGVKSVDNEMTVRSN